MTSTERLRSDGHRLLRVGLVLFLLGMLVGLGIPGFTLPRLAVATHVVGLMQGTFLLVAGLLWTRLEVRGSVSRIASGLAIYGCVGPWMANLYGAFWGAGGSMIAMASGGVRGTALQEGVIKFLLVSGAVALVAAVVLMLWGLRNPPRAEAVV